LAVDPKAIAKGKCYVTATGQVRHVIKVIDPDVTYEVRGKEVMPLPWSSWITTLRATFAQAVDREVPWNYPAPDSN